MRRFKSKTLRGVNVWISGALPEREFWPHSLYDRDILTFVAQLSRIVFLKGGVIIHGCHPSFTPILANQHSISAPQFSNSLQLYVSGAFDSEFKEKYSSSCKVNIVPRVEADGVKATIDKSLTALRHEMAKNADIMVVLGGKMHRDGIREPGIFEEIRIATEYGVRSYVLPQFGGATKDLGEKYLSSRITIEESDLDFLAHMLVKKVENEFSPIRKLVRLVLKRILPTSKKIDVYK